MFNSGHVYFKAGPSRSCTAALYLVKTLEIAFQAAVQFFENTFEHYSWAQELAGILPLSFLIDFIEIPPKLHILQLVGTIPLWSWVITPSGSRVILAPDNGNEDCCQDSFSATRPLEVLDGYYGERYFASNPETFRLVLQKQKLHKIENDHENMRPNSDYQRIQELEVIKFSRLSSPSSGSTSPCPSQYSDACRGWRRTSLRYLITNYIGWFLLACLAITSAVFRLWISLAFFLIVPITGWTVSSLHGNQPRLPDHNDSSGQRMLVVCEHMNTARWLVLIGESTLINSLLNRPLKQQRPPCSPSTKILLRLFLRICIAGQWGAAIAAAVTKGWSSYLISLWQCSIILFHAFLVTPSDAAKDWATRHARLKIQRFGIQASSRRALLNTIVALNPNTFPATERGAPNRAKFFVTGMKWIDPILTGSADRECWEEATRQAMIEASKLKEMVGVSSAEAQPFLADFPSQPWRDKFARHYWMERIPEGILLADKLRDAIYPPE
ncbi:hypothetical protein NQ176_g6156 [Zarea fungicola]|uniref:Uncharacterized protein n=1 Tax=Zarea fungicola TaxID=93591 RepID=A0ACC1N5A3_9HYPO|nr:hypothetical protein NQ176_g6156 [Lecanicillium fungicola]